MRFDVVGDRFIRRQVRALVSAAVINARDHPDDPDALLRVLQSGRQELTPHPAPALGLCFAQAGFSDWDAHDCAQVCE
jgi:tRNA U38,U39,U40 pseudouridine synthase TruA